MQKIKSIHNKPFTMRDLQDYLQAITFTIKWNNKLITISHSWSYITNNEYCTI